MKAESLGLRLSGTGFGQSFWVLGLGGFEDRLFEGDCRGMALTFDCALPHQPYAPASYCLAVRELKWECPKGEGDLFGCLQRGMWCLCVFRGCPPIL